MFEFSLILRFYKLFHNLYYVNFHSLTKKKTSLFGGLKIFERVNLFVQTF